MKRRVGLTHATLALAVIAAVAVAVPAIGERSATTAVTVSKKALKKLVKKEVAKQIGKATGPAGPAGTNGVNGSNGVDGTARAHAWVHPHGFDACEGPPGGCTVARNKGIASVSHPAAGTYCVAAPGIDSRNVVAAVSVDYQLTSGPKGNASAMPRALVIDCPADQFEVQTQRHGATTDSVAADNVAFTIVIP